MRQPPDDMRVLLVGGGGREHALAWRLDQSPRVRRIFTTHPENPGIASLADPVGFPFNVKEAYRLRQFCDREKVNLVVIGPEAPLAAGLADALEASGRAVVGPGAKGAQIEASKAWSKAFMRAASIPTADGRAFDNAHDAKRWIESREHAPVVKASGLAAGKGVIVPKTIEEALDAVDRIMSKREFADAGAEIVVEECLDGREASVFALVDGRTILMLDACQDHKRLLDYDEGPNTGGMGAYSPARVLDDEMMTRVEREIILPTVDALRRDGIDYRGVLYVGIMLTHAGPKVLEYNARFGDPECQTLMPRLIGDLADLLWRTASGSLEDAEIDWDRRSSCCVVIASEGYPEKPVTGRPISGIEDALAMDDVHVFHAGTAMDKQGALVSVGGRVLSVVALADDLAGAREKANAACACITLEGAQHRSDIGAKAI
ncbi:MAG: phosphoribosylamine--glycine ligase [Phycisphaerales bacterium]|nr:MAG: phosphoribosylamine--glycine ligase [Phycisphaerales bacterium]